ncbi:hypothetical protein LZ31DRAFT_46719 [Colletotrichum somersetense]|nr:hypothetical protein LZ31DRAFT_46719 [Colletotrichum somersetense]
MWPVHHPNQDSSLVSGLAAYIGANAVHAAALFRDRQLFLPLFAFPRFRLSGLATTDSCPPCLPRPRLLTAHNDLPLLTLCPWRPPMVRVASSWFSLDRVNIPADPSDVTLRSIVKI